MRCRWRSWRTAYPTVRVIRCLASEDGRHDAHDDEHRHSERQPLADWPLLEEGAHLDRFPVALRLHRLGYACRRHRDRQRSPRRTRPSRSVARWWCLGSHGLGRRSTPWMWLGVEAGRPLFAAPGSRRLRADRSRLQGAWSWLNARSYRGCGGLRHIARTGSMRCRCRDLPVPDPDSRCLVAPPESRTHLRRQGLAPEDRSRVARVAPRGPNWLGAPKSAKRSMRLVSPRSSIECGDLRGRRRLT